MTTLSFKSGNASDDYQDESGLLDNVEDQISEAFESLSAKSAKTRLSAYDLIKKHFTHKYMIEYIYNRKLTILDSIARCIKRCKGQDLASAANLLSILCITTGRDPELDSLYAELVSILINYLLDTTISTDVRQQCAKSAGICSFIIGMDGYVEQIMDRLIHVFSASFAKGDRTMPNHNESLFMVHSVSLQSWALLLTALHQTSPQSALEIIEERMDRIMELLDSSNLDLRISAGETLVVMYEIIKLHNTDVTPDDFPELIDRVRDLSTEAQKSRGKKDLKFQRSNFRELLAAIEEDEPPNCVIKFGREKLVLENWSMRRQYDSFCDLLGAGINQHLIENETLRDIFELGPSLADLDMPRVKRSDNYYENVMADKQRSKNMRKLRDKRSVMIN